MGKIVVAVSLFSSLLVSTAFAAETEGSTAAVDAATYQPKTEHDNTPYRFNMEQNGKRMSADEFDAWMKARGVRVATGKPAVEAASAPAANTDLAEK
jgi:hypothetical protein